MQQTGFDQRKVAVWFEIPAENFTRAVDFYQQVFQTELTQETMSDMRMAVFPHADTVPSGAVVQHPDFKPADAGSLVYLHGGDDLAVPLQRVSAAGGKVVLPKMLINDKVGYIAHFIDSEGNRIGLHSRQ